jgi:FkbM family methyltransferase
MSACSNPFLPNWLRSRMELESASRKSARATCVPASRGADPAILACVLGKYNAFLDPSNNDMMPWLVRDGFWEAWVTVALASKIQPGWHCIDGGAAMGYYTLLFADAVGPAGRVLAVEPIEHLTRLIHRSLGANGFQNTEVVTKALIDQSMLDEVDFLDCLGFGNSHVGSGMGCHKVQATTIDKLTEGWDRCDLVKLDIEGSEWNALKGAARTRERFPKCNFVIEFLPEMMKHDYDKYIRWLSDVWQTPREIAYDGTVQPISWDSLCNLPRAEAKMLWLGE